MTRGSTCVYDVASDKRRKLAIQRNRQDMSEAQINLERHQQLLGGIIATLRAGSHETARDLLATIRTGVDLSQLAVHVLNASQANSAIEVAFLSIESVIDGPRELPSLTQLLTDMPLNSQPPQNLYQTQVAKTFHPRPLFSNLVESVESVYTSEAESCKLVSALRSFPSSSNFSWHQHANELKLLPQARPKSLSPFQALTEYI